jgi:hypothetical protein
LKVSHGISNCHNSNSPKPKYFSKGKTIELKSFSKGKKRLWLHISNAIFNNKNWSLPSIDDLRLNRNPKFIKWKCALRVKDDFTWWL